MNEQSSIFLSFLTLERKIKFLQIFVSIPRRAFTSSNRKPSYSTIQDPRYITTIRPPVSYAPQKLRPQVPTRLQQQLQDYNVYSQAPAPEEFESVRYSATPSPPPQQQQQQHRVQYVQTVAPRPTLLDPAQGRVDLHQVLKSLQLTNQLPEVLNKDNIDSSIKTLMEILNILNMSKKESYTPGLLCLVCHLSE